MKITGFKSFSHIVFVITSFLLLLYLSGCGVGKGFSQMTMKEAQKLIEAGTDYLIVDVRTKEEYDEGHIPGAILLPIEDIKEGKLELLPDKAQKIMVYCWTGRRSEDSAVILADAGYTQICDIGGYIDWEGEIETGDTSENE